MNLLNINWVYQRKRHSTKSNKSSFESRQKTCLSNI